MENDGDKKNIYKILLVDDSADDAILISRFLKSKEIEIEERRIETQAEMQQALKEEWDAILCDYRMPNFSAMIALSELKKHDNDIPFIVVSGSIGEDVAVQMMKAGAHDYIMKDNLTRLPTAITREIREAQIRKQKHEATTALEKAASEWQITFDTMPESVLLLDKKQKIIKCNMAAENLIQKKKEQIIGEFCFKLLHKSNKPCDECPFSRMLDSKSKEKMIFNTNGKSLEITVTPILDDNNNILSAVHVINDITDLMQNQFKLEEALEVAKAANTAKTEFLATMSHEIRTPLNGIIGFSGMLQDELPFDKLDDADEFKSYFNAIQQCSNSLLDIINDILELSVIESGKFHEITEEFSPSDQLENVISALQFKAMEKELDVNLRKENLPLSVIGDPRRFKQITFNLLGNAIKFTDNGGIKISAGYSLDENKLIIEIADTGIGIPENKLKNIFDPFYQADQSSTRTTGGTGLGLTIVKRQLDKLGGSISIESTPGIGTKVKLTFPAKLPVRTGIKTIKQPAQLQSANSLEGYKVLAIEDDPIGIRYLEKILAYSGCNYQVVSSFKTMKKICKESEFDAILIDLALPDADGYQCLEWLKKNSSGKTVYIAQTAHALSDVSEKCQLMGFDGFITKPYKRDALIEMIRKKIN